jgi:hypothetical protein
MSLDRSNPLADIFDYERMGGICQFEKPDILHGDAVFTLGTPVQYTDFHEDFLGEGFPSVTIKVTGLTVKIFLVSGDFHEKHRTAQCHEC